MNLYNALTGRYDERFEKFNYLQEKLQGAVDVENVKFPKDLGEKHPFNYKDISTIVRKYGILSAIIDKHVDFMLSGGIQIQTEDERAYKILTDFMKDNDFETNIRAWLRQAFEKGFSPMELGIEPDGGIKGLKILKSDSVYVVRDDEGNIQGFNQYIKGFESYMQSRGKEDVIKFEEDEIADLTINRYDDCYYGMGIIHPLLMQVNRLLGAEKEMHTIMRRKANSPLIFIGGDKKGGEDGEGDYPTQEEISGLSGQLEYLNNKHEWVISDFWRAETIDFGNLGDKFSFIVEHNTDMLYSAAQVPSVLMGRGSVPEGLAKVQLEAFKLRIQSFREEAEKVIENKILKRVLEANGISSDVEVEWGLPTPDEKNDRAKTIIEALKLPLLGENFQFQLETKLAAVLGIPKEELETPEEEREREENQAQPIVPGQNGKKPSPLPATNDKEECEVKTASDTTQEHVHNEVCACGCIETLEKFDKLTLREWVDFNYVEYEDTIKNILAMDRFENLRGETKIDFEAGKLRNAEIEKLRVTFQEAFDENLSINEITKKLNDRIAFKDRYRLKDGRFVLNNQGERIIAQRAAKRAKIIARTETIRLSNEGALENYKRNGVEKVAWSAAMSDRTCPQCSSMNGMIFEASRATKPPLHVGCRCSLMPVIE